MSGGFTVEFIPARSSRRRIRYELQARGEDYLRISEIWNGCRWQIQLRENVREVRFTCNRVLLQ